MLAGEPDRAAAALCAAPEERTGQQLELELPGTGPRRRGPIPGCPPRPEERSAAGGGIAPPAGAPCAEREALLALTIEAAEAAPVAVDLATGEARLSDRARTLLGLPSEGPVDLERIVGRLPAPERDALRESLACAQRSGAGLRTELRLRGADGAPRWLALRAHVCPTPAGPRLAGLLFDVTEQRETEAALRDLTASLEEQVAARTRVAEEHAEQLHRIAAALTQAEQRERDRIARVLHDELQQLLVAAKMRLDRVPGLRGALDIRDQVAAAVGHIEETIAALRDLTLELSPPVARVAPLRESLAWLGDWFGATHDLAVTLVAPETLPDIPEHLRVFLFHSARELLFNVVKHARQPHATVELAASADALRLAVRDGGLGFTLASARASGKAGLGLFGMLERCRSLGGDLTVERPAEGGVRVQLTVPRAETVGDADAAEAPGDPTTESGEHEVADRIRLLVVDDHRIVREGLVSLLSAEADVEVVGEAADGEEAILQASALKPDIVVLDVTMPRLNGIEATRRIRQLRPATHVVGLSLHDEDDIARAMIAAGASSYVRKDGPAEELMMAIRRAHAGAGD